MNWRYIVSLLILIFLTITWDARSTNAQVDTGFPQKPSIRRKILSTIKTRLPQKHKRFAYSIARTITEQSADYKLDPLIVTAVIAGESSFNPDAVGPMGEIGLMQLRSSTAEWIARTKNLPWPGKKSLKDPLINIQLGMAYLHFLYEKLGNRGGYLYLAAYNMGLGSVQRHLANNVHPRIYSNHVMSRYITLSGI